MPGCQKSPSRPLVVLKALLLGFLASKMETAPGTASLGPEEGEGGAVQDKVPDRSVLN